MIVVLLSLTLTCVGVLITIIIIFSTVFIKLGITKDMTEKTILRCLQEVDNSRPYFIGTLAQRYGWHQEIDGFDSILSQAFDLAEKEPQYLSIFFFTLSFFLTNFDEDFMFEWIKGYRTSSVTEIEMLHGFLINGFQSPDHCFFLFRDESYLSTKDEATRKR